MRRSTRAPLPLRRRRSRDPRAERHREDSSRARADARGYPLVCDDILSPLSARRRGPGAAPRPGISNLPGRIIAARRRDRDHARGPRRRDMGGRTPQRPERRAAAHDLPAPPSAIRVTSGVKLSPGPLALTAYMLRLPSNATHDAHASSYTRTSPLPPMACRSPTEPMTAPTFTDVVGANLTGASQKLACASTAR